MNILNAEEYLESNGFKSIRNNVFAGKVRADIDSEIITCLKSIAKSHHTSRARVCLHTSLDEGIQQMLIVFHSSINSDYLKQRNDSTITYVVIEGEALLRRVNDDGTELDSVLLGESESGKVISKVEANIFRKMKVKSEFLVFYEIASGPFSDTDTEFYNEIK